MLSFRLVVAVCFSLLAHRLNERTVFGVGVGVGVWGSSKSGGGGGGGIAGRAGRIFCSTTSGLYGKVQHLSKRPLLYDS
jgi:hypothetical protein